MPRNKNLEKQKENQCFLSSQDDPKTGPDAPKTSPKLPKTTSRQPKTAQDTPRHTQDGPRRAHETQDAQTLPKIPPRCPQDAPKMASRWPQDGLKMASRWPQDGLKMALKMGSVLESILSRFSGGVQSEKTLKKPSENQKSNQKKSADGANPGSIFSRSPPRTLPLYTTRRGALSHETFRAARTSQKRFPSSANLSVPCNRPRPFPSCGSVLT